MWEEYDEFNRLDQNTEEGDHEYGLDEIFEEGMSNLREEGTTPEYLNSFDYNLNSPLIADDLDNFINWYGDREHNPHMIKKSWDSRRTWLTKIGVSANDIKTSNHYHSTIGHHLLRSEVDSFDIQQLVNKTDNDAMITYEVVKAFYKGWTKRQHEFISHKKLSTPCLNYGSDENSLDT